MDAETVIRNCFAAIIDATVMNTVGFFLDFAEKTMEEFSVDLLGQGGWRKLNDMDATTFKARLKTIVNLLVNQNCIKTIFQNSKFDLKFFKSS